ncbi:SUMF1/EgtB/PvdO family nonheme iron enzyme [Geoalkalibacter halelectricus]|uniref:SUMF1/EgtB/PvdO family nonheme iron enzyme n=1 Tax=Geoalkalibacter halelectricus TaxID=2847045 RepID=UPI003D1B2386
MSMIISIKDSLRQSVEAATGGQVTVMYDDKGYPSHMCRVPMFTLDTIDPSWPAVPHPAFVVNGTTKSEIWIGQYPAVIHDNRALSLPGRDPAASINFDTADVRCSAKGAGWHMMTNAEWAAIALLNHKARGADTIRGNTSYGRDHVATYETAPRQDGATPGLASGTARTLTGAGPASWRHNGEPSGIADLVGNVWEWQRGMRLVDGEIQVIADNNAADNTVSHAAGSSAWRAILQDGTLVAPGTANTLKWNATGANGTGAPQLALSVTSQSDGSTSASIGYKSLVAAGGVTIPAILQQLGLHPHATDMNRGTVYMRNAGERLPIRGGGWSNGADAGSFALSLGDERSRVSARFGFRPAFVL